MYRWLYWSDYYSTAPKILRVSMDGTGKEIIHDTGISLPYTITLDYESQVLYWADYTLNRIERSNVNGSNRQVVTTTLVNNAYSMTYFNGRLYWTDLSYRRILTAPSTPSTSTSYLTGTLGTIIGIKAVTDEKQPQGKLHIQI